MLTNPNVHVIAKVGHDLHEWLPDEIEAYHQEFIKLYIKYQLMLNHNATAFVTIEHIDKSFAAIVSGSKSPYPTLIEILEYSREAVNMSARNQYPVGDWKHRYNSNLDMVILGMKLDMKLPPNIEIEYSDELVPVSYCSRNWPVEVRSKVIESTYFSVCYQEVVNMSNNKPDRDEHLYVFRHSPKTFASLYFLRELTAAFKDNKVSYWQFMKICNMLNGA